MIDGNELDDDLDEDSIEYETSDGGISAFTIPNPGFSTEQQKSWAETVGREVLSLKRENRILRSQVSNVGRLATDTNAVVSEIITDSSDENLDPLQAPSQPKVTSRLGTFEIEWDGTSEDGSPLASSFQFLNVYVTKTADLPDNPDWDLEQPTDDSTPEVEDPDDPIWDIEEDGDLDPDDPAPDPIPVTQWPPAPLGVIRSANGNTNVIASDLTYNEEYTVWFMAVDVRGNTSPASARTTASVVPLVDTDVIGRVIDGANIELDALDETLLAPELRGRLNDMEDGIEDAQLSANGKNNIWYRPTTNPPPTSGNVVGDTWFVTDEDNAIRRWNGTAWEDETLGAGALDNAVTDAISDAYDKAVAAEAGTVQIGRTVDGLNRVFTSQTSPGQGFVGLQNLAPGIVGSGNWAEMARNLVRYPEVPDTTSAGWQVSSGGHSVQRVDRGILATRLTDASNLNYVARGNATEGEGLTALQEGKEYRFILFAENRGTTPIQVRLWYGVGSSTAAGELPVRLVTLGPGESFELNETHVPSEDLLARPYVQINNPVAGQVLFVADGATIANVTDDVKDPGTSIAGYLPMGAIDADMRTRYVGDAGASESVLEIETPVGWIPYAAYETVGVSNTLYRGQKTLRIIGPAAQQGAVNASLGARYYRSIPAGTYTARMTFFTEEGGNPGTVTPRMGAPLTGNNTPFNPGDTVETSLTMDLAAGNRYITSGMWNNTPTHLRNDYRVGAIGWFEGTVTGEMDPLHNGDLWYRTDAQGNIAEILIWNGGDWAPYRLVVDSIAAAGSITAASGVIADAAIGTAKIQDAAITDAKISNLDAAKITTGFLGADRIASRTIGAEKLFVGDYSNLHMDPEMDLAYAGWANVPGGIERSGTGSQSGGYNNHSRFRFEPGYSYRISATTEAVEGTNHNMGIYLQFSDNFDGPWSASGEATAQRSLLMTSPGDHSTEITPVGNHAWVRVGFYTQSSMSSSDRVRLSNLTIYRMNAGELLVDGSIFTRHLVSDSITSDKIVSNAITSEKIDALAVTAGKIATNAVTADKVRAGAITAAKLSADAIDGKTITGVEIIGGKFYLTEDTNSSLVIERGNPGTGGVQPYLASSWTAPNNHTYETILGNGNASFQFRNPAGQVFSSVDISGVSVVLSDTSVAGQNKFVRATASFGLEVDQTAEGNSRWINDIFSLAPGWSVQRARAIRFNGFVYLDTLFTRTGSALSVPASGNINNELVMTLPSNLSPGANDVAALSSTWNGPLAVGTIRNNGVYLTALSAGATLATGTQVSLCGIYPTVY